MQAKRVGPGSVQLYFESLTAEPSGADRRSIGDRFRRRLTLRAGTKSVSPRASEAVLEEKFSLAEKIFPATATQRIARPVFPPGGSPRGQVVRRRAGPRSSRSGFCKPLRTASIGAIAARETRAAAHWFLRRARSKRVTRRAVSARCSAARLPCHRRQPKGSNLRAMRPSLAAIGCA